jgi:NAD(P)-dependent dehydrogenase (short-subunit alcohol dehydrogenase family)
MYMTGRQGPLEGRVAVVTGGGQGIGAGIARALAEAGARVVIAQRREREGAEAARALSEELGTEIAFVRTDVMQREQVERMIRFAEDRFGGVDILVNNAGGSIPKSLAEHSDEEMETSFRLNYFGPFWAMRAVYPGMKARGWGRIINIGSLNGINALPMMAGYNASKEAVRTLSRTAAVEWGPDGITVNIISPCAMTPACQEYFEADPAAAAAVMREIPRRRMGDPAKDIGPVAVFLAGEASAHVTGVTLFVDGGLHINGTQWRPDTEQDFAINSLTRQG